MHHKIKTRYWFRNWGQWKRLSLQKRGYQWYHFLSVMYISHWRAI